MSARKSSLFAGIAGLSLALPLGYATFRYLAGIVCDPGDCYGEPAWIPLTAGLMVAFVVASLGLSLIDSSVLAYARERVFSRIGWVFVAGAIPTGGLTIRLVSERYCESGCSGDYLMMGLAAVAAGIAITAISLGLSVASFILARRHTRGATAARAPLSGNRMA